jgi:hypothetical protein
LVKLPHAMKTHGTVDALSLVLFAPALVRGEWSASRCCHFTTGKKAPGAHWIGGSLVSRAGKNDIE